MNFNFINKNQTEIWFFKSDQNLIMMHKKNKDKLLKIKNYFLNLFLRQVLQKKLKEVKPKSFIYSTNF